MRRRRGRRRRRSSGMDWKSYCRYEALYRRRIRRRTSEEAFYRRQESIVGRLNLISQHALPDSAARACRVEDRQRRELQNVMAHNKVFKVHFSRPQMPEISNHQNGVDTFVLERAEVKRSSSYSHACILIDERFCTLHPWQMKLFHLSCWPSPRGRPTGGS